MSPTRKDRERLEGVRRAKQALADEFGSCAWFRGVGITRVEDDWGLRLNVDPAGKDRPELPEVYEGFPVRVVLIGAYRKRRLPR